MIVNGFKADKMENKVKLFEDLFLPLQNEALGFALHLTRSKTAANDLFQETALKAFDKIDQFKPDSNPKAWFFTIMRNMFINDYRKKAKSPITAFEDYKIDSPTDTVDYQQAIEENGFESVVSDEVRAALLALDESNLTVFLLYAIHNFPYKEIAEITNTPLGTIKSSINRTKGKLKSSLQELAEREYGISASI